ncbi:hypothetical protein bcgnr5380_22300 [Bacillus cereus]
MIINLVMLCIGINCNKINIHTITFKMMHVVAADAEVVVDAVVDVAAEDVEVAVDVV